MRLRSKHGRFFGPREMSDLSPKSDPKRTLLSPSHLITIYEYTPLATYLAACHRWPGISVTLQQGARVIEDSRRLRVV
jgi:hypothetical protein